MKYNGGIKGIPVSVSSDGASGVWDLPSQQIEQGETNWPDLAPPTLFPFTTHTFTNAGAFGIYGPSLSDCQSEYNGATFLSYFSVENGTQKWTCPATATYRIECVGANGGSNLSSYSAGRGAKIVTDVILTYGTTYNIIVGQCGHSGGGGSGGHGGGGSWVFTGNVGSGNLIVCAGGGGGTGHDIGFGGNGSDTNTPKDGGGRGNGGYQGIGLGGNYSSNNGGTGTWNGPAGGGAGWGSDGTDARVGPMSNYNNIGYKGTRSGVSIYGGGRNGVTTANCGGFGGGGGGGGNGLSGGGGGGYTGGGGGMNWPGTGNPGHGGGQGGGSYYTGSLVSATAGGNTAGSVTSLSAFSSADGYVKITKL